MKNRITLISALFVFILSMYSCSQNPQPIDYGNDACHYCRMTIVDKIHGAEIVTDKGKVFKFDAAECLIRYKNELENTQGYLFLTNYFEKPEELVSMEKASFLVSENLPSPMGGFLTAFQTKDKAIEVKKDKGGNIHTWKEIQTQFKK